MSSLRRLAFHRCGPDVAAPVGGSAKRAEDHRLAAGGFHLMAIAEDELAALDEVFDGTPKVAVVGISDAELAASTRGFTGV